MIATGIELQNTYAFLDNVSSLNPAHLQVLKSFNSLNCLLAKITSLSLSLYIYILAKKRPLGDSTRRSESLGDSNTQTPLVAVPLITCAKPLLAISGGSDPPSLSVLRSDAVLLNFTLGTVAPSSCTQNKRVCVGFGLEVPSLLVCLALGTTLLSSS